MKKISYKTNDKSRYILTDVLPYEVPAIFTADGFFQSYNSFINGKTPSGVDRFLKEETFRADQKGQTAWKIPFSYRIGKAGGGSLTLSIMHPYSQTVFLDLYERYEGLIVAQCSKSRFSLRAPAGLHKSYVQSSKDHDEVPLKGTAVDLDNEDFSAESMYPSSYFRYKKYDLLYKFYESYEHQRLEKRFPVLLKFDISKCFYSIYTHTISWAVKSKDFAKNNRQVKTFENMFDTYMQWANHNETNGIVVGPEISRIFAEIILQSIDVEVEENLRLNGKVFQRDYVVRRYVDDFFVFARNEKDAEEIKNEITVNLEKYKLYINEAKTNVQKTPHISEISCAKAEVRSLIENFWAGLKTESGEITRFSRPAAVARNLIRDVKVILNKNEVRPHSMSGMLLKVLQKKLLNVLRRAENIDRQSEEMKRIPQVINTLIEAMSYFTATDPRVRPIYIFSQTLITLDKFLALMEPAPFGAIRTKMCEELSLILQKLSLEDPELVQVEICNILICYKVVGGVRFYEDAAPREALDRIVSKKPIGYFTYVTALFCMESKDQFREHKEKLVENAIDYIQEGKSGVRSAEKILVLLDSMACPFLSKSTKQAIFSSATSGRYGNCSAHVAGLAKMKWFVTWDAPSVERLLKKKELRPPYG